MSSSPSPSPTPFRFRTPSAFVGTLERGGPCSEAETEAAEDGALDCVICGFVDDSPFPFPFPFADEEPRATSTSLANSVLFAFCHQTSQQKIQKPKPNQTHPSKEIKRTKHKHKPDT
jgi:hypothetical protein